MATYVLVSGAWHASWCWERVVPLLEAAGHRVLAPDLLGTGTDETRLSTVTLADWAEQISEMIRPLQDEIILVGHSRGGIIISEVAERIPERIRMLVYLTAFLVPPGETLLSVAGRVFNEMPPGTLLPNADGTTTVNPEAVVPAFYNRTEAEWSERAKAQLGPEPMAVLATPLKLSDEKYGSVRRAYVECSQDNIVPLLLQRAMRDRLPCDPVITLETDHSAFYSAPDLLANCLLNV